MFRPILPLVLLATLIGGQASADIVHQRSERTDDAKGIDRVSIDNRRGRIELRASRDGRIHVTAVKSCRGQTLERARAYAAQTLVTAGATGSQYAIRVEYPRKVEVKLDFFDLFRERTWRQNRLWPPSEVQLVVEIPATLPARVTTTSADIDAEGLAGPVEIHSTSGDVTARSLRGAATIESASGDIGLFDVATASVRATSGDVRVDSITGPLNVRTASGDVTVRAPRDSVLVTSTSGDLQILDAPRGVTARTTSGDIAVASAAGAVSLASTSGSLRVRLRGPLAPSGMETVSGSVDLALVTGLSADLDLASVSGSLDCRVPTSGETRGRRSFTARVGAGGTPVRVHTVSGSVVVTGGGAGS